MVARYSDSTKLIHAKVTARESGYFIAERIDRGILHYLLYRVADPRNVFVGKRKSISGIVKLVKDVTNKEVLK